MFQQATDSGPPPCQRSAARRGISTDACASKQSQVAPVGSASCPASSSQSAAGVVSHGSSSGSL
eukprot:8888758-Lingulodinium_polyedra.AAC.1